MKTMIGSLFLLCFVSLKAETQPDYVRVTPLSDSEVWEGQIFHANMLWTGQKASREHPHIVEVYNDDGSKKLATVPLKHNVNQIYPYGKSGILVLGLAYEDQYYSYYSTIEFKNNRFVKRSYKLSPKYQFDFAALDGDRFYFTDIGRRKIYSLTKGRHFWTKTVAEEISNPGPLVIQDGSLWVIERRSAKAGDESLTRVNLKTGKVSWASGNKGRPGTEKILALADQHLIAMTEEWGKQIAFYNTLTGKYVAEVPVDAEVYDIQRYNNCVVAVDGFNKKMVFVPFKGERAFEHIDTWNTTVEGYAEDLPRLLSVNAKKNIFFTRSAIPNCTFCEADLPINAVFAFTSQSSEVERLCK